MKCPICKREAVEWPLERGYRCSPKDWVKCIRAPVINPLDVNPLDEYEPEQAYDSAHDLREHIRFGGTREDY